LVSSDPKVELINKLVGQQIKVDKPGFGLVFIGIGVVGLFLIVLILIGFLSVVRNALKKVS